MGNTCQGQSGADMGFDNPMVNAQNDKVAANLQKYKGELPDSKYAKLMEKRPALSEGAERIISSKSRNNDYQNNSSDSNGYQLPCYYINPLKAYYIGHWKNKKPSGEGKMWADNGNYYEGKFLNGLPHGEDGLLVFPDGSTKTGTFNGGMLNGKGKFHYMPSGMTYEGEWLNDLPHGQGEQKFQDGSVYKGRFVEGLKDDENATYTWENGKIYNGAFKQGYIHGKGSLKMKYGKGDYEGQFKRNLKVTRRQMKTEDGTYDGDFVDGQMSGPGVFKWYDGKIYKGQFKNNRLHGDGTMFYPNGQKATGVWEFGENVKVDVIGQGKSTLK